MLFKEYVGYGIVKNSKSSHQIHSICMITTRPRRIVLHRSVKQKEKKGKANGKRVYLKLIYNRSLRAAAERMLLNNVIMNSWIVYELIYT